MLDACERYVTDLAAAFDRYDRNRDEGARYRADIRMAGLTLGRDVRLADRENPGSPS
jgi:hypothetical protein